jgi:D-glycero-alpha-D-manno-heptose-7-phosphate kinase
MIISQTPLRISFVGGGTDLEDFWSLEPGKVLSTAIDKYIYVIVKERFDDLIYLNYSEKEVVEKVSDVKHDLVREAMIKAGIEKGLEITTLADIPSEGSGLGSSSSVTVGLLNAFYAYQGKQVTAEQLAKEACEIEIDILGKPIGKQDQYIAAYGGMREINFLPDKKVTIEAINIKSQNRLVFGSNLLLFYTDITRQSSDILTNQKAETQNKRDILKQIRDQVPRVREILEHGTIYDDIGQILHETWVLKKQITEKISNPLINEMYQKARKAGALGGKISGAGGGGFLLLYVPRDKQNKVRMVLKEYREFPFMLNPDGSKIIFNVRMDYWK